MDLTKEGEVVRAFPCVTVTIASTQAEKLISMMRRTAASMRNVGRAMDESLVRHITTIFALLEKKVLTFLF